MQPNIIIFLVDDMGTGDTSAYQDWTGNRDDEQLHTPSLERLARLGVRFTDAHTPSTVCTPTRATPSSPDAIAGARSSNTKSPLVRTIRHSSKKNAPHSPPSSKTPDTARASRENGTWA